MSPIHPSLYRPVLFLGVDQTVAIVEAAIVLALVVGVGLHLATVLMAVIVVLAIHPVMAWLTANDPLVTRIYLRSLGLHDFYAAQGALLSRPRSVSPSIPVVH